MRGIEEGTRAEHLQGLPDGLLVEHGVVRVAVLDALQVLVLGPEGVAGTLERVRTREEEGVGVERTVNIMPAMRNGT